MWNKHNFIWKPAQRPEVLYLWIAIYVCFFYIQSSFSFLFCLFFLIVVWFSVSIFEAERQESLKNGIVQEQKKRIHSQFFVEMD